MCAAGSRCQASDSGNDSSGGGARKAKGRRTGEGREQAEVYERATAAGQKPRRAMAAEARWLNFQTIPKARYFSYLSSNCPEPADISDGRSGGPEPLRKPVGWQKRTDSRCTVMYGMYVCKYCTYIW